MAGLGQVCQCGIATRSSQLGSFGSRSAVIATGTSELQGAALVSTITVDCEHQTHNNFVVLCLAQIFWHNTRETA